MLLLLSKACALNEHRQKETNLEMLVENARFQRNTQPFLGFLILLRVFWFFHESFGFPWSSWFCRKLFGFAESFFELFGFAVSYLVLPCAFWFCRELFGFVVSFLVFPWAIWFCLELFCFFCELLSETLIRAWHMSDDECEHYGHWMVYIINATLNDPFKSVLGNNQSKCRKYRIREWFLTNFAE